MNELHLGVMKNQELADWFGITLKTYTNGRTSKLKELETFAKFNIIRGGVEILEIIQPVYIKNSQRKRQLIKDVFTDEWLDENNNNLNTCANVARKMKDKYEDLDYTEETLKSYLRDTRKDYFGVPFILDGSLGSCRYLWAKAIPVDEAKHTYICEKLTDEELKIKDELLKKYFTLKNADDIEKKIIIKEMVESGEMTKDQAYDLTCDLDGLNKEGFYKFLTDLHAAIGYPVIKTTEILIGRYLQKEKEQLKLKEGEFNFE